VSILIPTSSIEYLRVRVRNLDDDSVVASSVSLSITTAPPPAQPEIAAYETSTLLSGTGSDLTVGVLVGPDQTFDMPAGPAYVWVRYDGDTEDPVVLAGQVTFQ